jgi:diacylglycerol kinase (ATP)
MIAVFVNPNARASRRNPHLAARFQTILGDSGRVLAPRTLEELTSTAAEMHGVAPTVIAIHGGDGTLHKTLTALLLQWGDAPLPPVAILSGGTMNVVASSLGLRERPEVFLQALADAHRSNQALATVRRRCVRVGRVQYGFIFGNGLLANFLTEYYGPNGYGPMRAVWILFRCLLSALVMGPFSRRMFRRFEGQVQVDGKLLESSSFVSVGAATVREVGLGFKLYDRADDDLDRFGVLAIHAGPLSLLPDMPSVHAGRGIDPSRALSTTATTLDVTSKAPQMSYTIDGDLYRTSEPIQVTVGPIINFIRPPDFIKPPRGLIAPASSDTINKRS